MAAQEVFSIHGYAHAHMREVAARASVNVALVARYFGSKEKLFEASLQATLETSLLNLPPQGFGVAVVSAFIDQPERGPNPLPMLVLASTDPTARAIALRLLEQHIIVPLMGSLGGPDAEARAAEILALTGGFFMYRVLLPLPLFQGELAPDTRRWLEETLQGIVDRRTDRQTIDAKGAAASQRGQVSNT